MLLCVSGCHRMWYIYDWGNKAQEPRVRTQVTLNPKLLLKYKILDLPSF